LTYFVRHLRAGRRRTPALTIVTIVAVAALVGLLPGSASAHVPPTFVSGPVITGAATVGSTLTAEVTGTQGELDPGDPPLTVTYTWRRCVSGIGKCVTIGKATPNDTYLVSELDVGQQIVVRVELRNDLGKVEATSPRTAVVTAATPAPPPTPTPTPTPTPAPTPGPAPTPAPPPPPATPIPTTTSGGGTPTFDSTGTSPLAKPGSSPPLTTTLPTTASKPAARLLPAYLRPFPVVRIRGNFARGGVRVTLLSVSGPRGATVRVRCSGRGCPVRRLGPLRAPVRLRRFERYLRAGVAIEVRVARSSRIGKFTSFRIRDRRAPLRRDGCLMPGRIAAARCPVVS
jgi:hypothetical protein